VKTVTSVVSARGSPKPAIECERTVTARRGGRDDDLAVAQLHRRPAQGQARLVDHDATDILSIGWKRDGRHHRGDEAGDSQPTVHVRLHLMARSA